jgi:hypothetical protein
LRDASPGGPRPPAGLAEYDLPADDRGHDTDRFDVVWRHAIGVVRQHHQIGTLTDRDAPLLRFLALLQELEAELSKLIDIERRIGALCGTNASSS